MQQASVKKYRRSEQRQYVLDYLKNSYEHPTAMRIFTDLKQKIPTLSLGNLYRNLGILIEQGEIIKLREPGSVEDRFDGHIEEHLHFFCTACNGIFDVPAQSHDELKKKLNEGRSWFASSVEITVRGHCPECAIKLGDYQ